MFNYGLCKSKKEVVDKIDAHVKNCFIIETLPNYHNFDFKILYISEILEVLVK